MGNCILQHAIRNYMKEFFVMGLCLIATSFLLAQTKIDDVINIKEVERIEKTLSSDEMRGRKIFTQDIDRAADFIAGEFKKIGLQDLQPATGQVGSDSVNYRQRFTVGTGYPRQLTNVVGVLPGKSRKDEYVIFSAHYDHLGVGKPMNGDSIYNGANDDASGVTAVIMLAKYFKALGNNERTIVFAAFTGEEIGGLGSGYFSKQFDAGKVIAMFNIEMIGTESKWGKNSAYITGYDKTDMGQILQKNLEGTGFTFYPDPYPLQNLFYRSDNATLALLGVPAHTISTSKMDSEPNYHKLSDQVETLDLDNMTMIINSIALSANTIIAGKDAPTRVKAGELK
jgi:Zn-dependent M28 family amino/carboxypeptidase